MPVTHRLYGEVSAAWANWTFGAADPEQVLVGRSNASLFASAFGWLSGSEQGGLHPKSPTRTPDYLYPKSPNLKFLHFCPDNSGRFLSGFTLSKFCLDTRSSLFQPQNLPDGLI